MLKTKEELIEKILGSGEQNQYYFAFVLEDIEYLLQEKAPSQHVVDYTLQLFRDLIELELIVILEVSNLSETGPQKVVGSPNHILKFIEDEWAKIGFSAPEMDQVFWYELSEKGISYLDRSTTK